MVPIEAILKESYQHKKNKSLSRINRVLGSQEDKLDEFRTVSKSYPVLDAEWQPVQVSLSFRVEAISLCCPYVC